MNSLWLILASVLIVLADLGAGWWLMTRLGRQGKPLRGLLLMLVNLLSGIALVAALWFFLAPAT